MSRNYLVLIIGLVILFLPFLGFPKSLDIFLTTVSGGALVVMVILSYIRVRLEHLQYRSHPNEPLASTPTTSSTDSTNAPELPNTP